MDVSQKGLVQFLAAPEAASVQDALDTAFDARDHSVLLRPHRRGKAVLDAEIGAEHVELVLTSGGALAQAEGEYLLSSGRIGDGPINGFSKAKVRLDHLSGVSDWRFHDLRASVATNLGKLGFDRFTIKLVLNHKDSGVTAVYDRYTYLDEKREALQKWADRLDEIVTK